MAAFAADTDVMAVSLAIRKRYAVWLVERQSEPNACKACLDHKTNADSESKG